MPPPSPVARRVTGPLWAGFKLMVLVVGGAIAFMPDEMRPVAWRLTGLLLTSESVVGLLTALGAVLTVFVVLVVLGNVLLPDEPGRPDGD